LLLRAVRSTRLGCEVGVAVCALCFLLGGCNRILGIEKLQPAPVDASAGKGASGGATAPSPELDAGLAADNGGNNGAGGARAGNGAGNTKGNAGRAGTAAANGGSGGRGVAGINGSGGNGGASVAAAHDAGAGTSAADAGGQGSAGQISEPGDDRDAGLTAP
jgi:hypothetical protein